MVITLKWVYFGSSRIRETAQRRRQVIPFDLFRIINDASIEKSTPENRWSALLWELPKLSRDQYVANSIIFPTLFRSRLQQTLGSSISFHVSELAHNYLEMEMIVHSWLRRRFRVQESSVRIPSSEISITLLSIAFKIQYI